MKSAVALGFVMVAGLMALPAYAQAPAPAAEPPAKVGAATYRGFVVETVYPLKIASYLAPTAITPRARPGSMATPEDTIIEMASSMKARDFAWNSRLWTPASLRDMTARDAAAGKTPAYWAESWQKYANLTFHFTTRIDYAKYVLIQYEVKEPGGNTVLKDTMALEQVGKTWFLTQALAADPVVTHWSDPRGRVQVAPEALFNK